ncbi:MAG: hypothetical protein Q8K93_04605 [Reyranella sp.]|uniref:hypothetical protein n=1 Tax=Reyranella sp. TaxID=1929291 RepID=UPI002730216D|nr:hypothetical protein [Reyranella sp.]MDP1961465.1 hypothetical protein [Reyranella sp.]MDP2375147.1 hypothetical protein [Reyranella sp.]
MSLKQRQKKSQIGFASAARPNVQAIDRPALFPLDPVLGLSLKQRHFLNPIRDFFGRP